MRLSGWTLIFPSQKSHSDRLLAEGIVLFALFVSLLVGFGLLYIAVPLGLGFFLLTLLCFVAFCLVRTYRWWMHG